MIDIHFSMNPIDENLSEFELGDIDITIDDYTISSRNKTPDQSMMIFIAIRDLLDGIKTMLQDKKHEFVFTGVDSSFALEFRRDRSGAYMAYGSKKYAISMPEFASSLRHAATSFLENKRFPKNKSNVIPDLYKSLQDFPA